MWVKQCHKPSRSHHHFYSWYMLVYIYIYIKTIPSHGGFIKPLFLATLNSHHLWPPQTAPSSVGRPRSKTSSTWLPETPLQSCEARSRSCSIWRMLGHVNTNIYFEKNIDILSMHICIYIYIYNHIYICMYVCVNRRFSPICMFLVDIEVICSHSRRQEIHSFGMTVVFSEDLQ